LLLEDPRELGLHRDLGRLPRGEGQLDLEELGDGRPLPALLVARARLTQQALYLGEVVPLVGRGDGLGELLPRLCAVRLTLETPENLTNRFHAHRYPGPTFVAETTGEPLDQLPSAPTTAS